MTPPAGNDDGRRQGRGSSGNAKPTRVGPAHDRPKRRREGTKALVYGVVLLLVAGAAVVGLTNGDVANRLALPWAPNAPTGPEPEPAAVQRSIAPVAVTKKGPKQAGVAAAMRKPVSNAALGSVSGSVIDPDTGKVLWSKAVDKPLPPASTTKLLTGAAALLSLDPESTLKTTIVAGQKPGTAVLVPGGDTTLSALKSGKQGLYPGAGHLDTLAKKLRKAGVQTLDVDPGAFRGPVRAKGWAKADAPSTFAAPIEPGMLDGGRTNPTGFDAQREAKPLQAMADELASRSGASVGDVKATAPKNAKVIGEVESAQLTQLVETMILDSDNVLAEAIARTVATKKGLEPSFTGGAEATIQTLDEAGFDTKDVKLNDGSGISGRNKLPAKLLTDILTAAAGKGEHAEKLRPLLAGLPVAGGSGTLADRNDTGAGKDGRGWVRAKTGTLSEVNALAGVVLDKDGDLLVFALMSSGTSPDQARPALDAVTAALRQCGCR